MNAILKSFFVLCLIAAFSVLFFLCFSVRQAHADSIYLGAWSDHISHQDDVKNSQHDLIAYEHNSYIVGYFKNSFNNDTALIGKRFNLFDAGDFNFGVYGGVTYGYKDCGAGRPQPYGAPAVACFALVPEVSYPAYKVQPSLILIGNAIAITFKVKL